MHTLPYFLHSVYPPTSSVSIHRNSYQIILFIVKCMFLDLVVSAKPQRKIEEILTYLTFCWKFVNITHMFLTYLPLKIRSNTRNF